KEALQRLMAGRTTLIIAHRLSTIEHADHIIVMSAGKIVESGAHADLLRADGQYARLYRLAASGGGIDTANTTRTDNTNDTPPYLLA
ncbi:MAG: hypothetical protein Q7T63_21545, partial [Burkholderiaceae bacterium]|nr:hypothetical protein [Burkholderiaceae bacterium]